MTRLFTLVGLGLRLCATAACAQGFQTWGATGFPFVCELPSGWRVTTQDLLVHAAAPEAGEPAPSLEAEFFSSGKDGIRTPEEFVQRYARAPVQADLPAYLGADRTLPPLPASPSEVRVDGRDGRSFIDYSILPRSRRSGGGHGPILLLGENVVVPGTGGFWILRYNARPGDFERDRPAFEHLLSSLRFQSAAPLGPDRGALLAAAAAAALVLAAALTFARRRRVPKGA